MKNLSNMIIDCLLPFIAGASFVLGINTETYAQNIVANHATINIDDIPQVTLDKARSLRMSLDHASVGQNIKSGMEDLKAQDEKRYAFPNWFWRARPNVSAKWKMDQFVKWVQLKSDQYDVFMMKFCFVDLDVSFTDYRDQMLALESKYPKKKFVWWTIPVMTDSNAKLDAFNSAVRKYCASNKKPLFDIADIESHTSAKVLVRKKGEVIAKEYTSDVGHLNQTGALRVAKGIWSLMAQLVRGEAPSNAGGSGSKPRRK